jgi:hypothetical protein
MSRAIVLDPLGPRAESPWLPQDEAEREVVQRQLDRILGHPLFRHSKRYPNLFRYVVEHTLSGAGHLKERTLGVEVFGRDPGYDTNEDPVVRITAGEIRKRIAQYYHEPGHESELRIDLPPGSYIPEFHLPLKRTSLDVARTVVPIAPLPEVRGSTLPLGRRLAIIFLCAGVLAVGALARATWVKSTAPERELDDFWAPVLGSTAPVLVCIGEPNRPIPVNQQYVEPSVSDHIYGSDHVALSDANALFHLAEFLGSQGKTSHLLSAYATSLTDLRQGPVVLIGAIDNQWTYRIAQPLQFHFGAILDQKLGWIEDRSNPARRDWSVNFGEKYSQLTQDYAIVARFLDSTTGQPVVIAAGLGENGTIAAGEFLTDPRQMDAAIKRAPSDWRHKNAEVVIATQVIDGKSGPPRVMATYFW